MAWQVLAQLAGTLGDTVKSAVPKDEYGVYATDWDAYMGNGGLFNTNLENISSGISLIDKGNFWGGLGSILDPGGIGNFYASKELNDMNRVEAEKLKNKKYATNTMWGDLSQAGRMSGIGAGFKDQYTKANESPVDLRTPSYLGGVVDAGISLAGMDWGGGSKEVAGGIPGGPGLGMNNMTNNEYLTAKSGIFIAKNKRGSLHKYLGVKEGDKIPADKLRIKDSDSEAIRKKKQFALNAKHFNHKKAENGIFVEGNEYDLNIEQIKDLEKQGYILKY